MDPISAIIGIGGKLINSLFPDKEKQEEARRKLFELQQDGKLHELEISMSAILAEAKSTDPWTSRARPSFLYVICFMILFAIPMGILSAFNPHAAHSIELGTKGWLSAIPNGLWTLFGTGYLGYAAGRSYDKKQILNLLKKD